MIHSIGRGWCFISCQIIGMGRLCISHKNCYKKESKKFVDFQKTGVDKEIEINLKDSQPCRIIAIRVNSIY